MTKVIIQIPFDGFYQSITESFIDNEIELYQEEYGEYPDYTVNFLGLAKEYVKAYVSWLNENDYHSLNLVFNELIMPKEYNFTTDKILCEVELDELKPYYEAFLVNGDSQEKVDSRFKSRSGFISFYDDFCKEWRTKPLTEWDQNELAILLPEPDYCDLWEHGGCNGVFCNNIDYAVIDN